MATKASAKRNAGKSTSGKKKRGTKSAVSTARKKSRSPKRSNIVVAKKPASRSAKKPSKKKQLVKSTVKSTAKSLVKSAKSAPYGIAAAPVKSGPKSPLLLLVEKALSDMKAVNVTVLDVRGLTDVADSMIIASGNSDRHVKSIADNVVMEAKRAGFRPMGVEGERDGEWALVDLQDVVVHVMLPRVREFYRLENLWDISAARRESIANAG